MPDERRRAHRFDREDLALTVTRDGRDMSDAGVVLKDVSRSGVGLQMSGRVDVGERLSFRREIPGGAVSGQASVRWVVEDNIGCRCGLQFQGLGFWDYFRLKGFLEPAGAELLLAFDKLLLVSILAVCTLLFFHGAGFHIASPMEILDLLGW